MGCQAAPDGSALYYATILTQATGASDFEIRRAAPEAGASEVLGRVAGARVPVTPVNFHALISPDGTQLAMPLLDGSTTNLWALHTAGGTLRKLVDFGERNVMIARRVVERQPFLVRVGLRRGFRHCHDDGAQILAGH